MVFSGSKRIVSLSPSTGERIWTIEGPTEQFVASMVFDGQQFNDLWLSRSLCRGRGSHRTTWVDVTSRRLMCGGKPERLERMCHRLSS